MKKRINRKFFEVNSDVVAKKLLGKYIVRVYRGKEISAKIVETESYHGFDDMASHGAGKRTPRNEVMFGKAGHLYIYLIYGMYYCLNVVTEKKEYPAAVLIRAVEIDNERGIIANGPGKLTKCLKIDQSLNREDIISSRKIWIEDRGENILSNIIVSTKRVNVDYAGECACWLRRFYILGNKHVSKV